MSNPAEQFAQNTRKLIDLLEAVDYSHSRLPRDILEDLQPRTRMCKPEYTVRVQLVGKLKHIRPRIYADIGPIDEKLINLAERLIRYVNTGEVVSAQMTLTALTRGIKDIRCNLPQTSDSSQEDFVSTNAKYLSQWISLVKWSEIYDQQAKNLAAQRKLHEEKHAELESSIDSVYTRIQQDPDFANSFFYILDHGDLSDRGSWTQTHRDLHQILVKFRVNRYTLEMSNRSLAALEQDQLSTQQKIDTLQLKLSNTPIVADSELMNEYRESMEGYIRDLVASDALTEETLQLVGELEGALKQLDHSASAIRQQKTATEVARSTMEQIQKLQQIETPESQDPLRPNNHN